MSEANGKHLPPGWAETTLGAIVEPRTGKANPQIVPDAKFIGMEHVEAHTMRLLGTVAAGSMKSGANTFEPFDVLYGRMRAYLNKVYQPDFSGLCSGEFIVFPETSAVLGRFLKYRLNSGDFVRFASHINTGDRPRVDFGQIKIFRLLLPPKSEQERIADVLDELLSDLDAGVATLERIQAKLKHYRAVVLKAAMDGSLSVEWRAAHTEAETSSTQLANILAERRHLWEEAQLEKFEEADKKPPKNWKVKYFEPAYPRAKNLPSLPSNWCWVSADQLCVQITDGEHIQPPYQPAGFPMLTAKNVRNGFVDFADIGFIDEQDFIACLKRCAPKKNDILIVSVGATTGRAAIVAASDPFALVRSVLLLRPVRSSLFLLYWIQSPWCQRYIQRASGSSAQAHLYIADTKNIPVPLPPLTEQQRIIETVENQLSVIDHLEGDLAAKLKSAQALRQSILRDAFTGKLVPQNPNDEPAAELLKRIAAEREAIIRQPRAAKRAGPKARRAANSSRLNNFTDQLL